MEKKNLSDPKLKTLEKDLVKVEKSEDYLDKEKLKLSKEKEKIKFKIRKEKEIISLMNKVKKLKNK